MLQWSTAWRHLRLFDRNHRNPPHQTTHLHIFKLDIKFQEVMHQVKTILGLQIKKVYKTSLIVEYNFTQFILIKIPLQIILHQKLQISHSASLISLTQITSFSFSIIQSIFHEVLQSLPSAIFFSSMGISAPPRDGRLQVFR